MNSTAIRTAITLFAGIFISNQIQAQASGGIAYNHPIAAQHPSVTTGTQISRSDSTIILEAKVLLNRVADEYVAIFGISEEQATIAACNEALNKRLSAFVSDLKNLGINKQSYYIDFVVQNRIYDYEMNQNVAREKLTGFELKKNISIHFKDKTLIDKLVLAASKHEIFDLIKVDYVVKDIEGLRDELFEEAVKIINRKKSRYLTLTGSTLLPESQLFHEDFAQYMPTKMYSSYTAYEAGKVNTNYRNRTEVIEKRKMTTFYFDPIDGNGYDKVIDQVVIEPVVQFSYKLQIKYEIDRKG